MVVQYCVDAIAVWLRAIVLDHSNDQCFFSIFAHVHCTGGHDHRWWPFVLVVQYGADGVVGYVAPVQVAMTIVDDVEEPPELQKDIFWNQVIEKVYFWRGFLSVDNILDNLP